MNDSLEVDDHVVKLGIEDLVNGIEGTRKIDHRILGTSLKGKQEGGAVISSSAKGLHVGKQEDFSKVT